MFTKKGFSVQPLEVTKQVLVDDILHFSEEVLQLYFENEGGDVEEVFLNEAEQSAVITFKDHRGNLFTLHCMFLQTYSYNVCE